MYTHPHRPETSEKSIQERYDELTNQLEITNAHFYRSDATPTAKTIGYLGLVTALAFPAMALCRAESGSFVIFALCIVSLAIVVAIADAKSKRKNSS